MVTGIVLAAGAGSRFGGPKLLAADGAWVRAAVAALRGGGCTDVVVVQGAARCAVAGARVVLAPDWSVGLSRSVAAGLRAVDGDCAVLPVDTPDVTAECVARVIAAGRDAPDGAARAVYDGRPGHPVYLARRLHANLIDALAATTGPTADRGVWGHLAGGVTVECGDLATGRDIDTLEVQ